MPATTLRFYESNALVAPASRVAGRRRYDESVLVRLDIIGLCKAAGFSLDEIRALVPSDLVQWEHGALLESLRRKVKDIEALEARREVHSDPAVGVDYVDLRTFELTT